MAVSTVLIGVLPSYAVGRYSAGVAAPVLLALLRMVQGLAMGGEYGSAIIYMSELARPNMRGKLVALLQVGRLAPRACCPRGRAHPGGPAGVAGRLRCAPASRHLLLLGNWTAHSDRSTPHNRPNPLKPNPPRRAA